MAGELFGGKKSGRLFWSDYVVQTIGDMVIRQSECGKNENGCRIRDGSVDFFSKF